MVAGIDIDEMSKDGKKMENIMNVMANFDPNKEMKEEDKR